MKPLERIFFKACLMKGDKFIQDICRTFSDLGFPIKILWRYLEKWNDIGFYDYGVALDMGWFYIDKLPIEYAKMYEEVQRYVRNTKH